MTESEKQEIVNRVLSALSTNSTTIDQMIETDSCADSDYFENSKGNKVSYGNMMKPLHKKIDDQEKNIDSRFSDLNKDIVKRTTELNISVLYPTKGEGGTNKYTLAGAIAQVPSEYRTIVGLKITFINNATGKTETWKYDGGTFTSTSSWIQGDGSGGNKILAWNTDVATTRKQVLQQERKKLLQISYENENGDIINEQYIGTAYYDTAWENDANWEKIPNQKQFLGLCNYINNIERSIIPNINSTDISISQYKKIENGYLTDKGVFKSDSNLDVYVFAINGFNKIVYDIATNISGYTFVVSDSENFDNVLLLGDKASFGKLINHKGVVNILDGYNYIGFNISKTGFCNAYDFSIIDINNKLKDMESYNIPSFNTRINLVEDLLKTYTAIENNGIIENSYINGTGNVIDNNGYDIYLFNITLYTAIRVKGSCPSLLSGNILVATYSSSSLSAATLNNAVLKRRSDNVDYEVVARYNEGDNVLAVVVQKKYDLIAEKQDEEFINVENIKNISDVNINKTIVCLGDSLTAGFGGTPYPQQLSSLLQGYNIINLGISGNRSLAVMARQGCRSLIVSEDFTLSAEKVKVSLTNSYGETVNIFSGSQNVFNPCYVDGIKCELSSSGGEYYIQNISENTSERIIYKGEPVISENSKICQNCFAQIIWMGTNLGDYNSPEELANFHQEMIDYCNNNRYLIIGLHCPKEPTELEEYEAFFEKKFGAKYVNWRKYAITNALSDLGLEPTEEDLERIAERKVPRTLIGGDNIHLTTNGYKAMSILINRRLRTIYEI